MNLSTVRVRMNHPNGDPVVGGRVTANLTGVGVSLGGGLYDLLRMEVVTDAGGNADLVLWPSEDSINGVEYRIVGRSSDGRKILDELVTVIESDDVLYLTQLLNVPAPSPKPYDEAAILAIRKDRLTAQKVAEKTRADADATADDRRQTREDRLATADDRERAETARVGAENLYGDLDAIKTAKDESGAAARQTAADREQTGEDRDATRADREQTAEDRQATSADVEKTGADRQAVGQAVATISGLADEVSTDRQAVSDDRLAVESAAGQVASNRDAVTAGVEQVSTDKDVVANHADQVAVDRQGVADDKASVESLREQISNDAQTVGVMAQNVSTDRQSVADDRTRSEAAAKQVSTDSQAALGAADQTAKDRQAVVSDRQAVAEDLTAASASAAAAGDYARMLQATYRGQRVGTEIIAHRGFRQTSIQNTLLALTTCLDGGADSLEFDVQMTMDGVPVLFHDDELSSLTSGTGSIAEHTWGWISEKRYLQADGTAYEGEGIPVLSEVLAYIQRAQCRFYPEIKNYRTAADVGVFVTAVQDARLSELCCWQSFKPSDLERVRELDAACEVGFLSSSRDQAALEALADQAGQHLPACLLLKTSSVSTQPGIVSYARARGVDIGVWTLDSQDERREMEKLGVTRLMCDKNLGGQ